MIAGSEWLLIGAVAAVGVLHTVVPDHWVPITLIARQQGWTKSEVARAALVAGTGHTVSTLIIGFVVWFAGVAVATTFGNLVSTVSSLALIAFGGWIAITSLRELRGGGAHSHGHAHGHSHGQSDDMHVQPTRAPFRDDHDRPNHAGLDHDHHGGSDHDHHAGSNHEHDQHVRTHHGSDHDQHLPNHGGSGHDHDRGEAARASNDALFVPSPAGTAVLVRHEHIHRHGRASVHVHLHDHAADTWHQGAVDDDDPPVHDHRHRRSLRTTLLLILGSSPMVEGIPAFFAAGKYGFGLIAAMALVFALATITTYIVLCVTSVAGLGRMSLGSLERYGEVLSGGFIALVGVVFLIFPVL